MSVAKNRIVREVNPDSIFPDASKYVDVASAWNQGDLLIFDDTTNLIRPLALEAEGETILGVAICTVVAGKLKLPYVTDVDASQASGGIPGPRSGVIAKMVLKTGEAFSKGDLVYGDPSDPAVVSSTAGTKAIGCFVGQLDIGAATAGQEGEILLGHRFPGDTLVM